jgi:hypothetical protein
LIYGTVRDQYGTPLSSSQVQVVLVSASGVQISTPIVPGISVAGVNYLMKVPLDSGVTPDLYQTNALVPGDLAKMVVLIGTQTNYPLEMVSNSISLGQWTMNTRVDLTLGTDSNGDGIPDAWEEAFLASLGLNTPLSSLNANSVLTSDGLTLGQEYLLGTYPFNPGGALRITFVGFQGASPILQFPTVASRSYTMTSSPDLKNWSPLSFNLMTDAPGGPTRSFYFAPGTATVEVYVAPPASGHTALFYRVQAQ